MIEHNRQDNLEGRDRDTIVSTGMDFSEKDRSGSFLQQDSGLMFARSLSDGLEIMEIKEALEKYPEAVGYFGANFRSTGRDFDRETEGGYFIRVKRGHAIEFPVQACLFLKQQGFRQKVHNLIVVEEGAKAYIITGCSASHSASEGMHLGISEFFVHNGAYLNFTMIHSWQESVSVKPVSIASVGEEAVFISNYVCLKPVRDITMYPTALLHGRKARASFNSIILSHPGSLQDVGSRVALQAEETQAEIISRAVSLGGKVVARGHIKASARNVKGHLECRGLILPEKGSIYAIPEMETDYRDVDLSHEAAIGRINKDEIEYLRCRGFSPHEAQSLIVRGFMDVGVLGLPDKLKAEIEELENSTLKAGL
ncbi:MAG: SufD family Fe-S cluster assembly protein [Candidatus Omnitrophota bacterium]|jgi:hypothetical protein